jgi:type II secretory pathway pseudopilin PulG
MVAVPLDVPELNLTTTRPLVSVRASAGSIEPSVVVKVTTVPLCGGVPAASSTCAMMSAEPFTESALVEPVSVIVEPVGARSGTFSQPAASSGTSRARTAVSGIRSVRRAMIKLVNILSPMHLGGQAASGERPPSRATSRRSGAPRASERGYAMAVLLVGMSVMAIMMAAVMPVWKHAAQREKEEELIFRGKQYARAVELYGRKIANALPPNIDVLISQKFLRKKYKDPITGDDFAIVSPNTPAPVPQGGAGQGPTGRAGQPSAPAGPPASRFNAQGGTIGLQGGVVGVVSKSKDSSIRIYNGRTHYNEWVFQYIPRQQAPGAGVPGQRGGPGQQPPGGIPGVNGRGPGGRGDGRGGPAGPFGGRGFGPNGQPFPPGTPPGPARGPAPAPTPQPQRPPGN